MYFLNFLFIREAVSPILVGVVCFVLGTHQPFGKSDKAEEDLAILNGCVVSACNYLAIVRVLKG